MNNLFQSYRPISLNSASTNPKTMTQFSPLLVRRRKRKTPSIISDLEILQPSILDRLHKLPQTEIRGDRKAEKEFVEAQKAEIISPNSRSTNFHKPVLPATEFLLPSPPIFVSTHISPFRDTL